MAQQIKKKYLDAEVISYFDDQINVVEAGLAQEIIDRAADDVSTLASANSYTDSEVSAAVTQVQGEFAAADAVVLSSAQSYTDGEIDALGQALEGMISAGDAATLVSANAYTDTQIATAQGDIAAAEAAIAQEILDRQAADTNLQNQINSVLSNVDPAALDSLTEIVTAFQAADSSLNGAITSLSTSLAADIASEEAARISADNALDARLDVLESVVWFKEKFVLTTGQTTVTLSHAPESKSISAFVDRLAIHEGVGEDFTVSGSVITFLNPGNGNGQIGNNDSVYVKYQYKV